MEVYRTRNNQLLDEIKAEILEKEFSVNAQAKVTAKTGQPLKIEVTDGRASAEVTGDIVQKAQNKATQPGTVIEKMKKTTGSGVRFETVCEISPDAFIPMSSLNELRRRAIEEFKRNLAERFYR